MRQGYRDHPSDNCIPQIIPTTVNQVILGWQGSSAFQPKFSASVFQAPAVRLKCHAELYLEKTGANFKRSFLCGICGSSLVPSPQLFGKTYAPPLDLVARAGF